MPRPPIDILALLALPASGKSELRKFLASMDAETRLRDFGIGLPLDLDDYPYVHFMGRVDEELAKQGSRPLFFLGRDRPLQDSITWNVLIELLNEDYKRLFGDTTRQLDPELNPVRRLLNRMDNARERLGMHLLYSLVPSWDTLSRGLHEEAQKHFTAFDEVIASPKEGATVVMEFARGGPHGSPFPIIPPRGYASALQTLNPAILERVRILYVKVTPEQARQKNIERGRPSEQGSILFHSVPAEVMLTDYGCDDIEWLLQQSDRPNTIRVERVVQEGDRYVVKVYYVPVAIFDNRDDLTSFVRGAKEDWSIENVRTLNDGLAAAMTPLLIH